MSELYERILSLLEKKNMSIESLAKKLDINKGTLYNIKKGSEPKLSTIVSIYKELDCDLEYLLLGDSSDVKTENKIKNQCKSMCSLDNVKPLKQFSNTRIIETFENVTLPITEFKKHIGLYLNELTSPRIILNHNKPSTVIVPYEQFKTMEVIIEKYMDMELVQVMEQRLNEPNTEYVETNEFFESLDV